MDGIAEIAEFPLIFGHDIAFHELFVMMQIIRAEQKLPAAFLHFFQREIKKAAVICFKFHKTVISQNLFITGEKFPGGESSSCMTFLWPGIGKIQVDPVYLTFSENLRKILGIYAEVTEIRKFFSTFFCEKFPFLKGAVENACVEMCIRDRCAVWRAVVSCI